MSAVAFFVLCTIFHVCTIIAYRRTRMAIHAQMMNFDNATIANSPEPQHVREGRHIEWRLTVYAFCTFVAQAMMAADAICIYVGVAYRYATLFLAAFNQLPLLNVSFAGLNYALTDLD